MSNHPHVAIAILNYNGRDFLEAYLPGVLDIDMHGKSVWVIDNASTDDSVAWLQLTYPQVRVVQTGANLGFAGGYNKGLQEIEADYYLILNNDVETPAGFLQPLVKLIESDRRIAFVQPKIRALRNRAQFEYAGAAGGLIDILGYPFCRGRLFDKVEDDHGQYDADAEVFWATGACMLARADAFRKLGGFYEFFFMHCEEIDLCWRGQNAGYKVVACGAGTVFHLGGGSLQAESPNKVFYNFRNNLVMITRNMPLTWLAIAIPSRFGLDIVAALQYALKGKAGLSVAIFRAWLQYLGWLVSSAPGKWPEKRGLFHLKGVFKASAVWKRYVG